MNELQLPIFIVFILALIISLFLNKISLNFKNFSKKDNQNNQKRLSNLKVPTYGGISMSLAFLVSTRLLGKADFEIIQIAIYAVVITFIGFIDDRYNLNWKIKLLFQLVAVSTPIYLLNIYLNVEQIIGINLSNILNLFFTVIWILLIVNSLNFLDNMDGLAATTATMIAISLGVLSYITSQYKLTDISIVLVGSMLGFLYFNFPKAKLYMGDSGSLFLGYCLGFISILFSWNKNIESSWIFQIQPVILFFTIPLLDLMTVVISRIKDSKSPMTGGTDHISHRLLKKGYTDSQVLLIFVFFSLMILALTMGILYLNEIISSILLIIYFISVFISLIYFLKLETLN
tara:strand:- start:1981 stop:3015 length:1035 start_codon:yes stop_codon:yes gene_type:complete